MPLSDFNFTIPEGLRNVTEYPSKPGSGTEAREQIQGRLDEVKDYLNNEVKTEINEHLADYTLQVPFGGTTTNSGNNYSIASPAISALTAGMAIAIKINANSTGATTLNWNGKGAKPIKKANGTDVTNLKAGGIYTLRYDGANFILQGEGASGDATASDLLLGKTATTDAGEIVGTIPLKGAQTYTPGTTNQVISAGQYLSGAQTIKGDANLVASNIRSGKSIFGVNGSLISSVYTPGDLALYDMGAYEQNEHAPTWSVIWYNGKIYLPISGTFRIKFSFKRDGAPYSQMRIYRNGVAYGTLRENMTTSYITFTEDLFFDAGDTCELWKYTGGYDNNYHRVTYYGFSISTAEGLPRPVV